MFGVGFSELLVIAVIALLVLGPERLPKAARFAGLWVRRARAQWYSVKSELERELASDELRRTLSDSGRELDAAARDLRASINEADRATREATSSMAVTAATPHVSAESPSAAAAAEPAIVTPAPGAEQPIPPA